MNTVDPVELMKGFRRVDLCDANAESLRGVLDDIRCVRARFDGLETEVARLLRRCSATAERDVAKAAQRSNRHGGKILARVNAIENTPSLGEALEHGELGGEHVDAYAKVLGSLNETVKAGIVNEALALIKAAATSGSTPEEFASSLNAAAERLAGDGGMDRLERQRRATRLRTWTDRATGMWHLSGAFDPESGVALHGRLEAAMAAMFATKTPSTTPSGPGEKQDHLRALALLALTNTQTTFGPNIADSDEWGTFTSVLTPGTKRFGRPEINVTIDTTNIGPDGHPTIDWGIPVTIPWDRIKQLCRRAHVRPIIIHNGHVIDADGELHLGRTTRLANRAQRRALQALYPTCAVPDCTVTFTHTKPHHLHWWRHGGPTNLANLLPLCSQHHHNAHDNGWLFTLQPNRQLTITLPNGQTMTTGPPHQNAAASRVALAGRNAATAGRDNPPLTSRLDESFDGSRRFRDHPVGVGIDGVADTVTDMLIDQTDGHALQRLGHR